MKRDQDDGIHALYDYHNSDSQYKKMKPDIGLIPTSTEKRRGKLLLAFSESPAPPNGSNSFHEISFHVHNRSDEPSHVNILATASDTLLHASSLNRCDLSDNSWHYGRRYDTAPPHNAYDLWTLTGHFLDRQASVASQTRLAAGAYIPILYAVLPFGALTYNMAPISIRINHEEPFASMALPNETPQWRWISGTPVTVPPHEKILLTIEGHPLPDKQPGYAHIAHIGFIGKKRLDTPLPEPAVNPFWQVENHQLLPHETSSWTINIPKDIGRVDIWGLEHGPKGKGYHIFKRLRMNEQ